MGLCVEDVLVKGNDIVIAVEQVEVLECLCDDKALLHVVLHWVGAEHVLDPCVAASVDATRLLQSLRR